MSRYDVIIVGAGIAGASAAYFLSFSDLRVAIVEAKPWERVGDKPCADAMGKHHFDHLGLPYPKGKELEGYVKGVFLYSPSLKTVFKVKGDGFEINRIKYTQGLLSKALNKGAEFFGRHQALRPILEKGKVVGIKVRNLSSGEVFDIKANVVIDASGNSRAIVRHLPKDWPVSEPADPKDYVIAYREVYELSKPVDEPEYIRIYLSNKVAPGGYWWLFPKSLIDVVNVGLGVQYGVGNPHPKTLFDKYIKNIPELSGAKLIEAGGALVPTCKPLDSLVWDGIAVIGDAAYTVNPVHGGGKGSSAIAAKCVADAVIRAHDVGNFSAKGLWNANLCYIENYGRKQAKLDIFRIFLQKLSDDDLEYAMKHRIVKEEDILEASYKGVLKMSVVDKALRVIAGLGKPSLLFKLKTVIEFM
ncbi:MAG TPA: NAD(P)/FAD-dependent oxidoreductase, partial [Acidilobales archaeon]|nr:NAD(P)/FAD-dependent oxidoreductase [Acidilobales archaeon]